MVQYGLDVSKVEFVVNVNFSRWLPIQLYVNPEYIIHTSYNHKSLALVEADIIWLVSKGVGKGVFHVGLLFEVIIFNNLFVVYHQNAAVCRLIIEINAFTVGSIFLSKIDLFDHFEVCWPVNLVNKHLPDLLYGLNAILASQNTDIFFIIRHLYG